MQRMQGPRDWMPPPDPPTPRVAYAWPEPPVASRPGRGLGLLSFVLGAGAAVVAIAPTAGPPDYSWYLFSTIGISAVAFGIVALRRRGRSSLLPVLGMLLGAFGTFFMVSLMVQFHDLQAAPPAMEAPIVSVDAPAAVPPSIADPPVVADERMQLAQAAGTVSFLLAKNFEASGTYPTVLNASSDGMILTPAGSVQLPAGANMEYVPAASGSGYALTISGTTGGVAKYDTATGVVTTN